MLRDQLLARLREMGDAPNHQRLAAEVLGIRGASADLARILVEQALVIEDRSEAWHRAGQRIAVRAPRSPGVYVLRDEEGRAIYVGKAVDLRRRLRTHFTGRRWRALRPMMSRVSDAEWREVGSELEALLREAALIHELRPIANVQAGPPVLARRALPSRLVRDVFVIVPSVEPDSADASEWCRPWRARRTAAPLFCLTVLHDSSTRP